jgi:hypothetical protein
VSGPTTNRVASPDRLEIEPIMDGDPETILQGVARLREVALLGPRVSWRGRLTGRFDAALLYHLPPPEALEDGDAEAWRAAYRYGSCYYRRGPGFIEIKDARDPGAILRSMLDTPDAVAVFIACQAPVAVAGLPEPQQEIARRLADRGLMLVLDGLALALPYRMSKWPVPFLTV